MHVPVVGVAKHDKTLTASLEKAASIVLLGTETDLLMHVLVVG